MSFEYLNFTWTPNTDCVEQLETAERPIDSFDTKRRNDFWNLIYVQQTGMAYGWGCWTVPDDFTNRISIGTEEDLFATDCNSLPGTGETSFEIAMGIVQNIENFFCYDFAIENTGNNPISVTIKEKYSGQFILETGTIEDGFSRGFRGWPGPGVPGYTQTLTLKIEPFFSGDDISWNASGCWSRKANQSRYAPGAHSNHQPAGAESPQNWAVGIDCSGLVGRAWELGSKPSTNTLYSNYHSVTTEQLNVADIIVNPGVHVVLVEDFDLSFMLVTYIHSCGALGVVRVENQDLDGLLDTGYSLRSYFLPTSVENTENLLPTEYHLLQNFPNPFNPSTTIRFALPKKSLVSLAVFNVHGSLVRELITQKLYDPGWGELVWDGANAAGLPVASGAYFYRLNAESLDNQKRFSQTKKLMLVR